MPDINTAVFLAIYNFFSSPAANIMFSAVTMAGHILFWAAAGLLLVIKRKKRAAVDLLAAALVTIIIIQFLKYGFAVPRPFEVLPGVVPLSVDPTSNESDPSFPSGHAALATMGAIVLGSAFSRGRPAFLALAALVMVSRIYLGVHYPADVLAGTAIGALVGFIFVKTKYDNILAGKILSRK